MSRRHLEESLNNTNAETYRIILYNKKVGGIIIKIDKEKKSGELDILFIFSNEHNKGIGTSTWIKIEKIFPEIELWITHTPYFEKRNIHFYINRLGFHVVEFIHNRNGPKKVLMNSGDLNNFLNLKKKK